MRNAATPEAAALEGRRAQRGSPDLVRQDWDVAKSEVMWDALNAKFRQNDGPRRLLLATAEMGMPYGETALVSVLPSGNDERIITDKRHLEMLSGGRGRACTATRTSQTPSVASVPRVSELPKRHSAKESVHHLGTSSG